MQNGVSAPLYCFGNHLIKLAFPHLLLKTQPIITTLLFPIKGDKLEQTKYFIPMHKNRNIAKQACCDIGLNTLETFIEVKRKIQICKNFPNTSFLLFLITKVAKEIMTCLLCH